MMYAKTEEFEFEFIKRTKRNLADYHGEFEVTHLINSFLGLIIIPRERLYTEELRDINITDDLISEELLSELKERYHGNCKSLSQLIRKMRNSIAHGSFEVKAEKPPYKGDPLTIALIVFYDKYRKKDSDKVILELTTDLLRRFVEEFSDGLTKKSERGEIIK